MNRLNRHILWRTLMLSWISLFFGATNYSYAASPGYRQDTLTAVFYFANNSSLLMREYCTNQAELNKLEEILRDITVSSALDSIVIEGSSSLIGSFRTNSRLSYERAMAVRSHIRWKFPDVELNEQKIFIKPSVINWGYLFEQVRLDRMVPYRDDLLRILSMPLDEESKFIQIKRLGGGATENYLTRNFARLMRSGTSVVFYLKEENPEKVQQQEEFVTVPVPPDSTAIETTIDFPGQVVVPEAGTDPVNDPSDTLSIPSLTTMARKPLFAIKTNLLYDLGAAVNAGIEIPMGQRWSLATEWVFPWWLWEKKQHALEVLNGNLELRYWWGERTGRSQMTGWFTGLYAGGGYYDVEWKTKGYQGEFVSAGITGGFAHSISKNWRMEYSLGLGYMGSKYREYTAKKCGEDDQWHLILKNRGNFHWVGPTQLKVSLVWMINRGYRK